MQASIDTPVLVALLVFLMVLGWELYLNHRWKQTFGYGVSCVSLAALVIILLPLGEVFFFSLFASPLFVIVGCTIMVFGLGLRIFSHLNWRTHLSRHGGGRVLMDSGVYKFLRNPMWVGIWLATLGLYFIAGSSVGVLLTFVFWLPLLINLMRKEEKSLHRDFGENYKDYSKKVKRTGVV